MSPLRKAVTGKNPENLRKNYVIKGRNPKQSNLNHKANKRQKKAPKTKKTAQRNVAPN